MNDTTKEKDITDFSAMIGGRPNPAPQSPVPPPAVRPPAAPAAAAPRPMPPRAEGRPAPRNYNSAPPRGGNSHPPMAAGRPSARPPQRDSRRGNSGDFNPRPPRGGRNYPAQSQPQPHAFTGRTDALRPGAPMQNVQLNAQWAQRPTLVQRTFDNLVPDAKLKIIPIGGIHDVQKNMYIYETEADIIIVDCGIGFPDESMPGVDFLIPDISYLQDKKDKVRAIIHTHGHDDHIGALPYIWPQLQCPVYASRITCGFLKMKMTEHGQPVEQINEIDPDGVLKLGAFNIQFFRLSHSIPDTLGMVIDTPVGKIVHCADFKFDWTPVLGMPTDVSRIAQFGGQNILALLSDCLGAEKPGYTLSERVVFSQFENVVAKTTGKMIITTTSSNISRIQQAMDVAAKYGRKVAISGRSMDQNIGVARNMGYLHFTNDLFVELDDISKYEDHELLLIVAGSQGQMESSLARAARDEHKNIKLREGDSVLFSTDAIPGNENQTNSLIDQLFSRGVEVYYSSIFNNLHVSGHAAQEELKLMLALVRPQYAMPIGGTERSTKRYSEFAMQMGMAKQNMLLPNDGDVVEFVNNNGVVSAQVNGHVDTRDIMVDGLGIGDLPEIVIRDRQLMAEEGMLVIIVPVDHKTGTAESGVEIVSRGFVFMKESTDLINNITKLVDDILDEQKGKDSDWPLLRKKIEDRVSKFIYKEIQRKPLVLPVVFEL